MEAAQTPPRGWRFYLANAWRWQGGPTWSRDMKPFEVFLAQSNAVGPRRLCGIGCVLVADAIYKYGARPMLTRGMKGGHLGLDAKPWSLTWIAKRAATILNDWRWTVDSWGMRLARYNS